ncbi:MAG: membrane or secreted protein [Bacteroidota bacterium]
MKKIATLIVVLTAVISAHSQSLIGAWEANIERNGKRLRNVVIFSETHQVSTFYNAENGAFLSTNGGSWAVKGDTLSETVEFDTEKPDRVGTSTSFEIELATNALRIKGENTVWKRVDDGTGALSGAWLISGRKRNGELRQRDTSGPRKTMKILSGTRFQWIAYNTETKEFMGSGGGTYTATDGKYTENIEFFSRDDSRVGATLQFDFALKEGDWHHSGLSSKGSPIYEVWSLRE